MLQTQKSKRALGRAKVSLEQAQDDLKVAKSVYKTEPDKSGLQSVQGGMNALSSVLEAEGYFQLPNFSTVELLDQCVKVSKAFEELRPSCYILDGTTERDLFGHTRKKGTRFTPAYARACYQAGEKIVDFVKKYWKETL